MFKSETIFFILILISNILISGSLFPLIYIAAALLHEFGHLMAINAFGREIEGIKFVGFGIRIKNRNIFSYRQEILISAIGPITNFALATLSVLLSIIFSNETLNHFIAANIIYALINLVPIPPLDGYGILSNFLYLRFSYQKVKTIIQVTTLILLIFLLFLFIFLLWNSYLNFSFLLILGALIVNAFLLLLDK